MRPLAASSRSVTTAVIALAATVAIAAQSAQTSPSREGSAVISGRLVDALTGDPIEGGAIQLAIPGSTTGRRQLTDDKGRFVFERVPAGQYAVRGSKPGYFEGVAGGDLPRSGDPGLVEVSDGQWASNVTIKLWPPAVITGTVLDEHGEPLVGVYVRTLVQGHVVGRDVLGAGPATATDDRGVYRISDLSPGRYIVMVPSVHAAVLEGAKARAEVPAPVSGGHYPVTPPELETARRCYPAQLSGGTIDAAAATSYALTSGMTQTVDLALTPSRCVTVSGHVTGVNPGGLFLRLLPRGLEDTGAGSEAATTYSSADGSFSFLGVPQGAYILDIPSALNSYVISGGAGGFFYGVTIGRPARPATACSPPRNPVQRRSASHTRRAAPDAWDGHACRSSCARTI